MAIQQIYRPVKSDVVSGKLQVRVLLKSAWTGEWTEKPYLQPVVADQCTGPSVSRAEFVWHYGSILHEDATAYVDEVPIAEPYQFVQIQIMNDAGRHALWIGKITEQMLDVHGSDDDGNARGDQRLVAYGLEHLLDRHAIYQAWIESAPGRVDTISHVPDFNVRHKFGLALAGNRSSARETAGCYVFGSGGSVWTNRDIAEYILKYHQPDGIIFELSGQFALLDNLTAVQKLEGLTILQALNKLIDHHRGLGWTLRTNGAGVVNVHVFSIFGEPFSVAGTTFAANQEQASFELDDAIDVQQALVRLNRSSLYDRIIVQGARMKSCFTASVASGILEPAWNTDEEQAYLHPGGADETADDETRRSKDFERVYQTLRISQSWDWLTSEGAPVNPLINPDGTLDETQNAPYWNFAIRLLRQLPLAKAAGVIGSQPEYQPPIIAVRDPQSEVGAGYVLIDSPDPARPAGRVVPIDREGAIRVEMNPNHLLGLNHFDTATPEPYSATPPEYDYATIIATLCLETDQHIRIITDRGGSPQASPSTLVIQVDDAELWYMAPRTMDLVRDGCIRWRVESEVLRDDRPKLHLIAALASAWYSQERAAVQLSLANLVDWSPPGSYVAGVGTSWQLEQVGTVVTRKRWDFLRQSTTLQTGFWELDVAGFTDVPGMSDLRSVGREFHRHERDIRELQEHVGNLAVRHPAGGSGITTTMPKLYRSVTDELNGEIDVQAVKSDNTLIGPVITLGVLP